jgi:flagellar motility protein MotE (MotC chaperone)
VSRRLRIPLIGAAILCAVLLVGKICVNGAILKSLSSSLPKVHSAMAEEGKTPTSLEIGLGEQLKRKEEQLRAKETFLKSKEAELMPLKDEVETKLAELSELQTRLTALAKELAEKEKSLKDEKMAHLVSLYGAMDPTKAAAIMDKLKTETVVLILRHMKGKSAGEIVGMMDPEKGALISEELSKWE